jgi:hypothetical protein
VKKIALLSFFSFFSFIAFAAFPVEIQMAITEADPEVFKLDTWGFIIGILTTPLLIFFLLPLLLLFNNKKIF